MNIADAIAAMREAGMTIEQIELVFRVTQDAYDHARKLKLREKNRIRQRRHRARKGS